MQVQSRPKLQDDVFIKRKQFADLVLEKQRFEVSFARNTLVSDEATFRVGGSVNQYNIFLF